MEIIDYVGIAVVALCIALVARKMLKKDVGCGCGGKGDNCKSKTPKSRF